MNKKQSKSAKALEMADAIMSDPVARYNLDLLSKIDLTLSVMPSGSGLALYLPQNMVKAYGFKAGQIWKVKAEKVRESD